jgi:hypothetical protein
MTYTRTDAAAGVVFSGEAGHFYTLYLRCLMDNGA